MRRRLHSRPQHRLCWLAGHAVWRSMAWLFAKSIFECSWAKKAFEGDVLIRGADRSRRPIGTPRRYPPPPSYGPCEAVAGRRMGGEGLEML
jgi:hypothetical protein